MRQQFRWVVCLQFASLTKTLPEAHIVGKVVEQKGETRVAIK
ncbi:hypothetical protein ES703_119476 [subsurface metagenome]